MPTSARGPVPGIECRAEPLSDDLRIRPRGQTTTTGELCRPNHFNSPNSVLLCCCFQTPPVPFCLFCRCPLCYQRGQRASERPASQPHVRQPRAGSHCPSLDLCVSDCMLHMEWETLSIAAAGSQQARPQSRRYPQTDKQGSPGVSQSTPKRRRGGCWHSPFSFGPCPQLQRGLLQLLIGPTSVRQMSWPTDRQSERWWWWWWQEDRNDRFCPS